MILLARKFVQRPAADRWLLVRAFGVHACMAALLRVARFRNLSRWLAAAKGDASRGIDPAAVERVVWAVRQAAAAAPWGRTCLTEALTAAVLLRRAGCETTLRYGVASAGAGGLDGHAWLEYRGDVILGHSARSYGALHHAGRTP
jgi:Transglutaminase-like superfamily